ncbi:exonuclease domain-containing protein [Pelomicrobium sp. G1]|uniref:3'-5' exonuclease n=1 Tax=unclassified Pelomicrobium TaxID=2815318 RepID=UPI003F765B58
MSRGRFVLVLALCYGAAMGLPGLLGWLVWRRLPTELQGPALEALADQAVLFAMTAVGVLFALAILLELLSNLYLTPIRRLREDLQVMLEANPAHRASAEGAADVRALVESVNRFAEHYHALLERVEARVEEAKRAVEEEKNRLAAVISELAQGVLVCNIEGQILLYNNRARQLLSANPAGSATGGLVGLGRSVFGVIDRPLILHALDTIHSLLSQKRPHAVARFVTTAPSGQLVRALVVPVLGNEGLTGFVMTLEDVTRTVEQGSRRDALLQSVTEGSRAALASIRAAVETLQSFPDMPAEQQGRFIAVISQEASRLSERIEGAIREFSDAMKAQWVMEDMLGEDLVAAACRRIETRLGLAAKAEILAPDLWMRVDSFALVQVLAYLAARLKEEFGVWELRLRLAGEGRLAHLDLVWRGAPLSAETVFAWESEPLTAGGEDLPLTVKDVIERHDGEIWYQRDRPAQESYFRLLIPASAPETVGFALPAPAGSRPEYYDFDLFRQQPSSPALDERRLTELKYTVFDTETTGLEPSAGDEIISIGAVRIVNGRLLLHEVFDQLVDPRRPMSPESIKVTGIDPSMLRGQPPIEAVLPAFHRFCEDSVLVAHNAAFDLRFLQMKEAQAGVKFDQPVLDTLLLSAAIQPNQEDHKLEAIAARLGVPVVGRHTALGDAIVTAEVFLKMIPLLAERGIHTLRQAREASQRTYYARVRY